MENSQIISLLGVTGLTEKMSDLNQNLKRRVLAIRELDTEDISVDDMLDVISVISEIDEISSCISDLAHATILEIINNKE